MAAALAAALAAGAAGVWVGTALLACPETRHGNAALQRLLSASAADTVLTHVFDHVQDLAWPDSYPGRALRNTFTDRWHGREQELRLSREARDRLRRQRGDFSEDVLYAGQAVGLVDTVCGAGEVIRQLG